MDDKFNQLEQDSRFPSGKWTGFFVQKNPPLGKQWMDLQCVFEKGIITASGNDIVGAFTFKGHYDIATGKCSWNKLYKNLYYQFHLLEREAFGTRLPH